MHTTALQVLLRTLASHNLRAQYKQQQNHPIPADCAATNTSDCHDRNTSSARALTSNLLQGTESLAIKLAEE
jgi:hypothetical protein